jgi:hypothetical protein
VSLPKEFKFRINIYDDNTIYHAEYAESLDERYCTREEQGHEGYIISWRDKDTNLMERVSYLFDVAEFAVLSNAWIIIGNSTNNKLKGE